MDGRMVGQHAPHGSHAPRSVYLSTGVPLYRSIHPSIYLPIYFVCPSTSVPISIYLPTYPSIHPSILPSIHLSILPSILPPLYLSTYESTMNLRSGTVHELAADGRTTSVRFDSGKL